MKPLKLVALEENECKLNMPSNWPKNVKRSILKPWRFQNGDLVMVYDSHHDGRSFKKLLPKWFGPYIIIKIFFLTTTYMNWFTLMERNVKKSIMTNLSIFIMVELLF
jgi:hypothetical protein